MHSCCWEVLSVPAGFSPAHCCSLLTAEEQEYSLPQEAFPLRHEIVDNPSALDHLQDKADSPHVSGNEAETVSLTPVESFSLISISHSLYENRLPSDFFNPIVRDTLLFYAEQGDVQMAVSVLIVLGERIRKEIDEQTQVEPVGCRAVPWWDPEGVYPNGMGSCLGLGHIPSPPAAVGPALSQGEQLQDSGTCPTTSPGRDLRWGLQGQDGEVTLPC